LNDLLHDQAGTALIQPAIDKTYTKKLSRLPHDLFGRFHLVSFVLS
jgi:hypothetical protein